MADNTFNLTCPHCDEVIDQAIPEDAALVVCPCSVAIYFIPADDWFLSLRLIRARSKAFLIENPELAAATRAAKKRHEN